MTNDQGKASEPEELVLHTGRLGRRAFANLIDTLIITLVSAIGITAISGIYLLIVDATSDCTVSRDGKCDPSIWLDRGTIAVMGLWIVAVTYVVTVRAVMRKNASFGMRQCGLEVVCQNPGQAFSTAQLVTRAGLSQSALWVGGATAIYLAINRPGLHDALGIALVIALAVIIIGSAALILAPGHRSIADAATNTRVIRVRPMSIAAAAIGLLAPIPALAVAGAVAIGLSDRPDPLQPGVRFGRRNFEDFDWLIDGGETYFDLAEWFTDGTVRWILLAVVWLALVALSWIALRSTRWQIDRLAGRGLALTAGTCVALAPITLALIGVWAGGSALVDAVS